MARYTPSTYHAGITQFEEPRGRARRHRFLAYLVVLLALLWVGIPLVRTGRLLFTSPVRSGPPRPYGLSVRSISFRATDGVLLHGWFVPYAARVPSIVLLSGFQDGRSLMVPYARFLHAAGFNVLLYDSRGTGASEGTFSLGVREVNDVRGAVAYLNRRQDLRDHHYGLLGVSLGAGVAIAAAAHLPSVRAVVADSPYANQEATVQRLDSLHIVGPLTIPLAPIAPWLVDRWLGTPLSSFSPLRAARKLPPRPLLLIRSKHDTNPTTPLKDARALDRAAAPYASLWIAPRGGHAGALAAQPGAYKQWVVGFFRRYLH